MKISKGEAEAEMKRAEIFARLAVGIPSVIEPNWTDRQFVAQPEPEPVTHIVKPWFFGSRQEISGVEKRCALELAVNRKGVLDIEDRIKLTANRVPFWIVRTKISLAETTHAG